MMSLLDSDWLNLLYEEIRRCLCAGRWMDVGWFNRGIQKISMMDDELM
jgi:hypothetical protein